MKNILFTLYQVFTQILLSYTIKFRQNKKTFSITIRLLLITQYGHILSLNAIMSPNSYVLAII
jgi:hypothetical protein